MMALLKDDEEGIAYSDSIIRLSENKSDAYYPATGYLIKGSIYYNNRRFKKSLDNYLLAYQQAQEHNNEDFILNSKHSIAILKDRIGEFEEALQLKRENYEYAIKNREKINDDDYLNFLFALANIYSKIRILDSASYYNKIGIFESRKLNSEDAYSRFLLNEGVTKFRNLQYKRAFDSIIKAIPYLKESDDQANLAIAYYHIGKINFEGGKEYQAIDYLKKVDSIFNDTQDLYPEIRDSYELLINFYKKNNDIKEQLYYVEQLLKLDSILNDNNVYISTNIIKEYDIPKLEEEKELLIQRFNRNTRQFRLTIALLSIAILIILGVLYYQYRKRKLYKNRFEKLLEEKEKITLVKNKADAGKINIPEDIVSRILEGLRAFEENKEFTTLGLTSQILAKKLKTNTKYLSMVVNHFKQQSFINYLNSLRVEHAIGRLKKDPVFRRYTVQAIAKEAGFNNTESFSKTFYKKTGIKPSYFVKELNRKESF